MLTYEKIREIQRNERSKELQPLPKNFLKDFEEYIERKKRLGKKEEVENARFILRDILNRRERKIVSAALDFVRTGIKIENLSEREKALFNELVAVLKKYRGEAAKKENVKKKKEKAVVKKQKQVIKKVKREMVLVRIKEDLPDFVGPKLNIYSLRKKEIANLPKKIAEILVKNNLAEKIGEEDD